jgi:hypothetical protein
MDFLSFRKISFTIAETTYTEVPGNKLTSQKCPYFADWPLGRV